MRALHRVCGIALFGLSACTATSNVQSASRPLIGGTTDSGDPAAVAVVATGGGQASLCSGVVVSPHVVLTSSTCTDPTLLPADANIQVFIGPSLLDFSQASGQNTFAVQHVDYDTAFNANDPMSGHDIGAVRTMDALPVTPLSVSRQAVSDADIGQPVRYVGYGATKANDNTSSAIRVTVTTPLTEYTNLLLVTNDPARGSCGGDSGAPLLMKRGGQEVVVGLASYGAANCDAASYSTRIDPYWDSFIAPQILAAEGSLPTSDAGVTPHDQGTNGQAGTTQSGGCSVTASDAGSVPPLVLLLLACVPLLRGRGTRRPAP